MLSLIPRDNFNMKRRKNATPIFWNYYNSLFENFFDFDKVFGQNIFDQDVKIENFHINQKVSIHEADDNLTLRFNVAGFSKDDLELSLEDRQLNVVSKDDPKKYFQAVKLTEKVDLNSLTSTCKNGILTVNAKFVKLEEPKVNKRIIKIG